eukprot:8845164-Pyramimonas_sp.AAC.1
MLSTIAVGGRRGKWPASSAEPSTLEARLAREILSALSKPRTPNLRWRADRRPLPTTERHAS